MSEFMTEWLVKDKMVKVRSKKSFREKMKLVWQWTQDEGTIDFAIFNRLMEEVIKEENIK